MNNPTTFKTLKAFAIGALTFFTSTAFAQATQSDIEIVQETYGLEKKKAIANFMELGEDTEIFWALYDEYEAERKKLGNERIKVIEEYASNYASLSDEKILELFKKTNDVKRSFAKLQETYFNNMEKERGVSKAAQFWQLENYFSAMMQANIYSQLPFIGELDLK